jgi:NAD(P)-dependent dehydrogenase (short-subunit alcohol dehydrogenase family)
MGLACAVKMIGSGPLLLVDLDKSKLHETAAAVRAAGAAIVETMPCDITDPNSVSTLAARVGEHGGLRALIHTAGISPMMAEWQRVLDVDLVGTVRLLDALFPHVSSGSVAVCFASLAGHVLEGTPELDAVLDEPLATDLHERVLRVVGAVPDGGEAYKYAKYAVIRLCEQRALPWGARGARIVSLSPGLMDTAMGRLELDTNPAKAAYAKLTPLVRAPLPGQSALPGTVEDIADATAFLCSNEASFLTGIDLRVDGGIFAAVRHGETDGRS